MDSLQLYRKDLIKGVLPTIVNTGNSFLILPLETELAVSQASPRMDAVMQFSEKYDLIGYYLFSSDTRLPGRDAGARMFAPRYGIAEESATGMAAGPLAGFLFDKLSMQKSQFVIEQGHLMEPPSPSQITVKLNIAAGRIKKLMAGGKAKVMESIYIET
jgi:PhzF family phenazine biosynthesis protein